MVAARPPLRVAVGPEPVPPFIIEAVRAGGGERSAPADAEAVVWASSSSPDELERMLADAPGARWVQLPWAGIEPYVHLLDPARTWTSGKGVYAEPVAEHALGLAIACLRQLPERARASSWGEQSGTSLYDAAVTVFGGGGITERLLELLAPMRSRVTVVRRRRGPMPGAARVVGFEARDEVLEGADLVVLALALTPETDGFLGADQLRRMPSHSVLVNVARGRHVVTDDLVRALHDGVIGGAGLDVTEPEPLPDGHPLFSAPNCVITPHTANTKAMAEPHLSARISTNVRRYVAGEPLVGLVDVDAGY